MKRKILLMFVIVSLTTLKVFAERYVLISRIRINGDGSGLYNSVSRDETNVFGMSGNVEGTIVSIGCTDPGSNPCPLSRPTGGGPITGVDESVANYMEERMSEIQGLVNNGTLNFEDTHVVSILMSNGENKLFRVEESWSCNSLGDGTIELRMEELNG